MFSKDRRNLFKNISFLMFVQVSNYIAPFVVFPYLTRLFGLEEFGVFAFSLAICGIAKVITDYGFDLSSVYFISNNRDNKKIITSYLGSITLAKTLLFLIVLFFLFIYGVCSGFIRVQISLFYSIIAMCFTQTYVYTWFFNGIEKMYNVAYVAFASKVFYVFMVFFLIDKDSTVSDVIYLYAVSNIISLCSTIFLIYISGYGIIFKKNCIVHGFYILKESHLFFLSRASVSLYTTACTFFVGSFAGMHQAAIYSSAEKIYQAGKSLISPVSQALFPYISRTGNKKELFFLTSLMFAVVLVSGIFVLYFSRDIVYIIFGQGFEPSAYVLNVFVFCLIISFLSLMYGYPAFSLINRVDLANKSVVFSAFFQILSIVILVMTKNLSAINIALSVTASESMTLFIRVWLFHRINNRDKRNATKNI